MSGRAKDIYRHFFFDSHRQSHYPVSTYLSLKQRTCLITPRMVLEDNSWMVSRFSILSSSNEIIFEEDGGRCFSVAPFHALARCNGHQDENNRLFSDFYKDLSLLLEPLSPLVEKLVLYMQGKIAFILCTND